MSAPRTTAAKRAAKQQTVKTVNLALQGGGSHGAYTWGVLDAFAEDTRIEISAISGASAGTMNAVVFAYGLQEGGRDGARESLGKFWLSVSSEGSLAPFQRKLVNPWLDVWGPVFRAERWMGAWTEAISRMASPYLFNPLNLNPLRDHLTALVDFDRLRASNDLKLFVAATNVRTGRGEIFRRPVLTADHAMASACLPGLFQAVVIDRQAYWDGGFAGNPPLWPLFYETTCSDAIIVQINPIERHEIPETAGNIVVEEAMGGVIASVKRGGTISEPLAKASAYRSSASQLRFKASASCANGELYSSAAHPSCKCSGATVPMKAACSMR